MKIIYNEDYIRYLLKKACIWKFFITETFEKFGLNLKNPYFPEKISTPSKAI